MENEATLLRQDIAELDAKINELKNRIEARTREFNREVQERESDPMWQVAATDYIQKGDRSGLENYHNTKLMQEEGLFNKINDSYGKNINYSKELSNANSAILRYKQQLKKKFDELGDDYANDPEVLDIKQMLDDAQSRKESILAEMERNNAYLDHQKEIFNKRYPNSKFASRLSGFEPISTQNDEIPTQTPKKESGESKVSAYIDEAEEWVRKNAEGLNDDLTIGDVNRKVDELVDKMQKDGISRKDIAKVIEIIKKRQPSLTDFEKFKAISGFNEILNGLDSSATYSLNDGKFKKVREHKGYNDLTQAQRDELGKIIASRKAATIVQSQKDKDNRENYNWVNNQAETDLSTLKEMPKVTQEQLKELTRKGKDLFNNKYKQNWLKKKDKEMYNKVFGDKASGGNNGKDTVLVDGITV